MARKKLSKVEQDLLKSLGARIRELRQQKNDSYENFAFEHDLPRAQFGRYELGTNVTILSLCRVLKALDISLKEFFATGFEEE
jgi:transcriptional regulator with XRE-family HTH domain